jgi:hypothetical protein
MYNAFREILILLNSIQLSENPKGFEDKVMTIINLPDYSTDCWIKLA